VNFSLNSFNWFAFAMETQCVLCKAGTELLNIIWVNSVPHSHVEAGSNTSTSLRVIEGDEKGT
jgi:hypothetical protein